MEFYVVLSTLSIEKVKLRKYVFMYYVFMSKCIYMLLHININFYKNYIFQNKIVLTNFQFLFNSWLNGRQLCSTVSFCIQSAFTRSTALENPVVMCESMKVTKANHILVLWWKVFLTPWPPGRVSMTSQCCWTTLRVTDY